MMRYTPWIVSEHVPDFSTMDAILKSPRFAGKQSQDLAIALWELMVDHDLGIFHYLPAQEDLWGQDAYDPLKIFNVFGFTICHVHANVLGALGRAGGFRTRIANVAGHEGTEFYYDGGWRYFDADIQMYYRLRPPDENVIASRQDLHEDPALVYEQANPSFPYHMPDRLPEKIYAIYETPPEYLDVLCEQVHSMDYRLRPGEEMTRYFHNRGRWVVYPNYPEMYRDWPEETGPEGPTERFWPRRQWGNGFFRYAPKLSSGYADVEVGADELTGLSQTEAGLVAEDGGGAVVFALESPYVYCGVPDPLRRLPPVDGAVLRAEFDLPEGTAATIEAAPELSDDWERVWVSEGGGQVECELDFTDLAEGRYRVRLRFALTGKGAALKSFETRMWFMVSPHSLPALRNAGDNRMRLHCGDRFGLGTRPIVIEHRTDDEDCIRCAFATENVGYDPNDRARLSPADPARPWWIVYELSAPNGGRMGWMSAFALVRDRKPGDPDDERNAMIEIADSPDGPWRTVGEREIVEQPDRHYPQGPHFGIVADGRFSGQSQKGYVRFSAGRGAHGFRIMGHYVQRGDAGEPAPLEVEHAWYEVHEDVGRRLHTHVERIAADEHEYVVHCGREPHDEYITLRVPSLLRP